MGKRFLKDSLTNPICNSAHLQERYDLIGEILSKKLTNNIGDVLKEIYDIERLHRKIAIGRLHPLDFVNLHDSYINIVELYKTVKDTKLKKIFDDRTFEELVSFMTEYQTLFNLEEMYKYMINDISGSIYKSNIHKKIDNYQKLIREDEELLEKIRAKCDTFVEEKKKKDYLNNDDSLFNGDSYTIKELVEIAKGKTKRKAKKKAKSGDTESKKLYLETFDSNDSGGKVKKKFKRYYLRCTKLRGEQFEKRVKSLSTIKVTEDLSIKTSDIAYDKLKSAIKILIPELNEISTRMAVSIEELQDEITKLYVNDLIKIHEKYNVLFNKLTNIVAKIDFLNGGAICVIKNKYYKPVIKKTDNSYIKVKKIRHPILEKIMTNSYIPYDTQIGCDNEIGMLLYGLNSAGKSSLMKSIGLNLILAQIGYYVAAKEFVYSPYHSIFTRIINIDNIHKNLSSFTFELYELKAVLKRSGNKTLVLADEVCNGTEHKSALIIVAAMIKMLINTSTSFISATHLHKLTEIKTITELNKLKINHIEVSYDDDNNIRYDRKLKGGNGSKEYGLDYAKHIIGDREFIRIANEIKNEIENKDLMIPTKKSRYNSDIYMKYCQICEIKKNLESHHIEFQRNCDDNGFILKEELEHVHKNHSSNIVVLCDKCHDKIDNKMIVVYGYEKTMKGRKLKYEIFERPIKNNKYDATVTDYLKRIKAGNNKLSQRKAKTMIKNELNIDISVSTISNIWRGVY